MVIVADTGLDDALALAWCVDHPELDVVAVIATYGNTDRGQAARNSRVVLDALGAEKVPVFEGAAGPIGPAIPGPDVALLMGADGLGGCSTSCGHGAESGVDGAAALVSLAREHAGRLEVLALAPLTTLATALDLEPDLPAAVASLTVMGGSVAVGGLTTALAEPNIANDPMAAAAVIDAFAPLDGGPAPRLVPLDVTRLATLCAATQEALTSRTTRARNLLGAAWAGAWVMAEHESLDGSGACVHDLVAAVSMTDPVLGFERLPVQVDTAGSAGWGATVVDRRARLFDAATLDEDTRTAMATMLGIVPTRWDVATTVDATAFDARVHAWWSRR